MATVARLLKPNTHKPPSEKGARRESSKRTQQQEAQTEPSKARDGLCSSLVPDQSPDPIQQLGFRLFSRVRDTLLENLLRHYRQTYNGEPSLQQTARRGSKRDRGTPTTTHSRASQPQGKANQSRNQDIRLRKTGGGRERTTNQTPTVNVYWPRGKREKQKQNQGKPRPCPHSSPPRRRMWRGQGSNKDPKRTGERKNQNRNPNQPKHRRGDQ